MENMGLYKQFECSKQIVGFYVKVQLLMGDAKPCQAAHECWMCVCIV